MATLLSLCMHIYGQRVTCNQAKTAFVTRQNKRHVVGIHINARIMRMRAVFGIEPPTYKGQIHKYTGNWQRRDK